MTYISRILPENAQTSRKQAKYFFMLKFKKMYGSNKGKQPTQHMNCFSNSTLQNWQADKGSVVVVLNREDYFQEANNQTTTEYMGLKSTEDYEKVIDHLNNAQFCR